MKMVVALVGTTVHFVFNELVFLGSEGFVVAVMVTTAGLREREQSKQK